MKAFGSDVLDTSIFKGIGLTICGILDEASVEEILSHALCHVTRHRECCSCGCCYDPTKVLGIWSSIGLGKLEG
jgi:hypothetical protein